MAAPADGEAPGATSIGSDSADDESGLPEAKTGSGSTGSDGTASPPPPDEEPVPQAATTDKSLQGKLTQADILALVHKHNELFNDCYTIGAGDSQQFVATVTVKATIGPSGKVSVAEIIKSTAKNPKVDDCVATAFKKMPFPKPADGATSVITFPMKFEGAEEIK